MFRFLRSLSIRVRLFAMAGISSAILLIVGWIGLASLQRSTETLQTSLTQSVRIATLIDEARDTQGELVKQWKEWKDLLIRGQKKDDFEKYYGNFQKQDSVVTAKLASVRDTLAALEFTGIDIGSLIDQHTELSNSFRQALTTYDPTNVRSTQRVDSIVRGTDRALTAAIDGMIDSVMAHSEARHAEIAAAGAASYRAVRAVFIAALVIAVIGSSFA